MRTAFQLMRISVKPLFQFTKKNPRIANTRSPHLFTTNLSRRMRHTIFRIVILLPLRTVGVCRMHAHHSSASATLHRYVLSNSWQKSESVEWAHACLPQSMINKPISLAQRNKWDNHIYQAHTRTHDTLRCLRELGYKLKKKKFIFVCMACDRVSLTEGSLNTIEWN